MTKVEHATYVLSNIEHISSIGYILLHPQVRGVNFESGLSGSYDIRDWLDCSYREYFPHSDNFPVHVSQIICARSMIFPRNESLPFDT